MSEGEVQSLVVNQPRGLLAGFVDPNTILGIVKHVQDTVKMALKEGVVDPATGKWDGSGDFAVLPGTNRKVLLKPGAEKLLLAFSLTAIARDPVIRDLPGGHREVTISTEIRGIQTGILHAIGIGSCSTMEAKYRYRGAAGRTCPSCGAVAAKASKKEFGGGYYCDQKGGGCGSKFKPGSEEAKILDQTPEQKQENPDPADTWNTVLKMSAKRSMIAGVLQAVAASGMFTQDIEDQIGGEGSTGRTGATGGNADQRKTSQARQDAQGSTNGSAPGGGQGSALTPFQKKVFAKAKEAGISNAELKAEVVGTFGIEHFNELSNPQLDAMLQWIEEERIRRAGGSSANA